MSHPVFDEPEFTRLLRAQDHGAFRRLVQAQQRAMVGFAATLVGREAAEDVVQEAWVAVYRGLPGFEGRASVVTWLYTIVRHACVARLRKDGRVRLVSIDGDDSTVESWFERQFSDDGHWNPGVQGGYWHLNTPETLLEETHLRRCVESQMEQLPPDQLAVFRLRELQQMELDDICNILEVSASNVRVLLHRARLRLLRVVDHYQRTGECRNPAPTGSIGKS